MKKVMKLAILMGMGLWTAGMLAQTSGTDKAIADKPTATGQAPEASSSDSDYVIGADDILRISVWKEPDLSETLAGASRWQDFDAAAERHSCGGSDSVATQGLDYRETEKVHLRSARNGSRDGDEQPANFCIGRGCALGTRCRYCPT